MFRRQFLKRTGAVSAALANLKGLEWDSYEFDVNAGSERLS